MEINKLQKSNTALEKERAEYITKWKSCHNSVLEISEKNQQLAKKLEISEKKVATLEKLCRQLQTERTTLHKQLQDKIEPLLGSQNIDETNQISSIDAPKPVVQNPAPENLQNEELPNQSLNGNAKSTNCHRVTMILIFCTCFRQIISYLIKYFIIGVWCLANQFACIALTILKKRHQ